MGKILFSQVATIIQLTYAQSSSFSSNGHTWDVQLRYSNTCQTVWTRLQETSGSGAALYNPVSEGSISQEWDYCYYYNGTNLRCDSYSYVNTLYGVYDGAWTNMWYVGTRSYNQNFWDDINAIADYGSSGHFTELGHSSPACVYPH